MGGGIPPNLHHIVPEVPLNIQNIRRIYSDLLIISKCWSVQFVYYKEITVLTQPEANHRLRCHVPHVQSFIFFERKFYFIFSQVPNQDYHLLLVVIS